MASTAPASPPRARKRPYFHLYLVSPGAGADEKRSDPPLRLSHAAARHVGQLLEWLYVPLGRSGSSRETYLIYEQREEYDAARRMAVLLDRPAAGDSAVAPAGDEFEVGISQLLSILEQGAVVDDSSLEKCLDHLDEAVKASSAPSNRWAAAMLAGRVLMEYRYDFTAARQRFDLAARQVSADSIEAMSAMLWTADALLQEGKRRDAAETCEDLLDQFVHRWPNSYAIARASAMLKKLRDR